MSLSAVDLGPVAAGVLSYGGEVVIETGELATGYEVNIALDGVLRGLAADPRVMRPLVEAVVAGLLHTWTTPIARRCRAGHPGGSRCRIRRAGYRTRIDR